MWLDIYKEVKPQELHPTRKQPEDRLQTFVIFACLLVLYNNIHKKNVEYNKTMAGCENTVLYEHGKEKLVRLIIRKLVGFNNHNNMHYEATNAHGQLQNC
jgi:alpha-N-acetylglucosamine transferase